MGIKLHVCFDLGSDTLKIVYAYKKEDQSLINFGKIMFDELINQSAIPATAYFDEDQNKWLFADQVEDGKVRSFVNTVKIKQLLSLVRRHKDKEVFKKNKEFYNEGHFFPKFYFPIPLKISDKENYQLRIDNKMVFEDVNHTPQQVCEDYFDYIYKMVMQKYNQLCSFKNIAFEGIDISLVYPPKSGMDYVNELKRIIKKSFRQDVNVSMITTKALSLYAKHKNLVKVDEPFLVFDMGESNISVVKAKLTTNRFTGQIGIVVEGSDGHSNPIELGGNDLDDAILSFIEGQIKERETIGTASFGDENHIVESGVHSKQFMLVKNIKKAKMILSKEPGRRNIFKDGVPISIHRDVRVNRILTKEQLLDIQGITSNSGVAKKIKDYVINELNLPINRDVTKVFLAGGLIETYGLFEYIVERAKIESSLKNVSFTTFVANTLENETFPINSFEDSTFAAAIGCAFASLQNYSYETCLSLSYGTWYKLNNPNSRYAGQKFLKLFDCSFVGSYEELENKLKNTTDEKACFTPNNLAEKGNPLPIKGINFFVKATIKSAVVNEELYSINLTKKETDEIMRGTSHIDVHYDANHIFVGQNSADPIRRKIVNSCQLKVVAGGERATISLIYKDTRVKLLFVASNAVGVEGKLKFFEGISMDCDGFAKPFVINACKLNAGVTCDVEVLETTENFKMGARLNCIPAQDLEFKFMGVDSFDN